jgi:hypothetical protein
MRRDSIAERRALARRKRLALYAGVGSDPRKSAGRPRLVITSAERADHFRVPIESGPLLVRSRGRDHQHYSMESEL